MPRQLHIIAVDDDPLFLFVMQQAIAVYFPGAALTTVSSAEDAVDAFDSLGADLLVTDHHLGPGMSGIELVAALRARRIATPIVVLSSDDAVERGALAAGATAFIAKGGSLELMVAALSALVR